MGVEIKNKIKSIRELKNYTQAYMADRLEITQAAYSKIEKGTTNLTYSNLEKIASIFEINIESIIQFNFGSDFLEHNTEKPYKNCSVRKDSDILNLYEDKIFLLEKLLNISDTELNRYRDRFGSF